MGFIETIRRWFNMLFVGKAKEEFDVRPITSSRMDAFVIRCMNIYAGKPEWLNAQERIKTINFAKSLCEETARLATLALGISIDGSARADWLQEQMDKIYYELRGWVEYGCECGTVIFKPNGEEVELVTPDRFFVTEKKNGKITGVVFHDQQVASDSKPWFNRLEYHRFLDSGEYAIDNKTYIAEDDNSIGEPISIENTPWAGLEPSVIIEGIERPLYGVLKMPGANNIDIDSPLGMPVFAQCIEELRDLDIAYSRNVGEISDSQKIVLLDSDRMLINGRATNESLAQARGDMHLPHYIRNVEGSTDGSTFYQEIVPSLNTAVRIQGIDQLLSLIGYKCGYSNGYFVFDQKSGMVTATQVESDDRRTIQFIKDVRDRLEDALTGVIYALDKFADLYDLAPVGAYNEGEMFHFGDITYNFEEDKISHYNLALQGRYPWVEYYVKFMKYSREEAEELLAQAQAEQQNAMAIQASGLFKAE